MEKERGSSSLRKVLGVSFQPLLPVKSMLIYALQMKSKNNGAAFQSQIRLAQRTVAAVLFAFLVGRKDL